MNIILQPKYLQLAITHTRLGHEFLPVRQGILVGTTLGESIRAEPSVQEFVLNLTNEYNPQELEFITESNGFPRAINKLDDYGNEPIYMNIILNPTLLEMARFQIKFRREFLLMRQGLLVKDKLPESIPATLSLREIEFSGERYQGLTCLLVIDQTGDAIA